ncbi:hypothetical protein BDP27DRAFT_1430671 [Rhodocollybia butyracea]|uniref:DUF6535 domain-containing protein n=1 Tax=Rhodocollybia butyracea TaxID=206335 RepID=A0A9P5PAW1_9AGAR|nr:hypothetical protein BDP27DRAFT_1430671 [Rhodocollybia butyracea]
MRSMHSMMQAREEREASIMRSSPDATHRAVASQPTSSISIPLTKPSTSTQHAGAHPTLAPDPRNHALPTKTSDPTAGTLTSILNSLHKGISELQHTVTASENRIEQGTKNGPFRVRRFGLKMDQATRDPLAASYDYTLKYPEDERYHEQDQEARIWRVYGDEATAFDNDMVGELGDSLDILLVFAGLFSAVLTTFVAQTSQSLSQDYTQLSAFYLSDLTMLVHANANKTAILNIPLTSATAFSPAILDLWINGLWFTSLVISLSVALFAVLAKQWLRQYMSIITGTPREQAFIRQFRFDGLEKWRVQSLIGMLPTLLHLALILFFAGLIIFLIPLSTTMAYVVGAISVTVVILYLVSTVLPLFTIQCSYRTTLTHLLYSRVLYALFWKVYTMVASAYNQWVWKQSMKSEFPDFHMPDFGKTLKEGERFIASHTGQNQNLAALKWLDHYTSNPSTKSVLVQSLGALPPGMLKDRGDNFSLPGSQILERLCTSTNLDELEGWLRAGLHSSFRDRNDYILGDIMQSLYESNITDHNCDITSALSALAYGLSPVKFFHAGQCMKLTAEDAIKWVLKTYKEGPPLDLPMLVWKALLEISGYDENLLKYLDQEEYPYTVPSTKIRELLGSTFRTRLMNSSINEESLSP